MLRASKPKLLDELGYMPFEANAAHLFFQLVSRRDERGSMLITSNRSVAEWGAVFGGAVVATAILDRLLHHSHVITIRGDSYRLRSKRRAGLVNQASPIQNHQPIERLGVTSRCRQGVKSRCRLTMNSPQPGAESEKPGRMAQWVWFYGALVADLGDKTWRPHNTS
ncbi:ATP-binding protein [Thiomonas sp.]